MLRLSELPPFVAVDWEQTAANCKVDGMGHHFSSYDGEEHNTANFLHFPYKLRARARGTI